MILKNMTLTNFRQFKGKQTIVFAEGNTSCTAPCITVLYGENGRGKTGIYRALMFGLYGDCKLSQDDQANTTVISLVNRHLVEENLDQPTNASVEIEFSDNHCSYHLRREIAAIKTGSRIVEQLGPAKLRKQDETGNTKTYSEPQDILQQVSQVLDYRVREYFLFDGEKIERLTRASSEQRKAVAAGIRQLLNIDDLEKSIKAAEKLCRELDQNVKNKSTGELQQVIQKINEKEDEIKSHSERIDAIDSELDLLQREKISIDKELNKYQEIRSLVEERKSIEQQQSEVSDKRDALDADCRVTAPKMCFAIIQPVLQAVFDDIDAKRKKGDIPPLLRSDLIQELLVNHKCICGRELLEGTEPFNMLLNWMEKIPKSSETDAALQIWKQLGEILRDIPEKNRYAKNRLIDYADNNDKLYRLESRLESISEQIGANERSDAVHLDKQRLKLENKHITMLANQKLSSASKETANLELNDLKQKRQRLENDSSIRDALICRSQMARKIKETLSEVYNEFKTEAAIALGEASTRIMERLLDEEGRQNLKKIVVADDYSLQIVDQWDGQFLANISAGQRQIMSIAFITALANAASNTDVLEMPLFMDTPFGRLSQNHRNNLIREIPKLSSQWVLLATDTELRREEGAALLSEKRLGRFYRLSPNPDGTTSINEQSLQDVPVLLKSELEVANV